MKLSLHLTNGTHPYSGYGQNELGILTGLIRCGVTIDQAADVLLIVGFADWLAKTAGRQRKWLYTMSESTKVSARWVKLINARAERVLVPCPELVDIYRESGVEVPVHFVGHSLDVETPFYVRPKRKTFTFLSYSLGDIRKGAHKVILAFKNVFGGDPRYRLMVKCREKRTWLSGCREPQIQVIEGAISEPQWRRLLRRADAGAVATYAEGFGMVPRTMVLSGLPTISTKALGQWDVNCWGFPIEVAGLKPAHYSQEAANAKDGLWWEPDQASLEAQMQYVAQNYEAALAHTRRGAEYLTERHSPEAAAKTIIELLERWA